jgi:hypothetical protein
MSLNSEDKIIIKTISVFFILVVLISFFISFFSVKHNVEFDLFEGINSTNESSQDLFDLNNSFSKDFFLNYNETNITEQKQNSSSSQFDVFDYDVCTPFMNFSEHVKINKRYKFEWDELTFFVNEKLVSSKNNIYIINLKQNINYDEQNMIIDSDYYYDSEGKCLKIFYDFSNMGENKYEVDCDGNPFSFMCEEMLNDLNYSGVEKYYVYGETYDVNVYSNMDDTIILKYGVEVPILFYFKDYTNKRIKIELLGMEENLV